MWPQASMIHDVTSTHRPPMNQLTYSIHMNNMYGADPGVPQAYRLVVAGKSFLLFLGILALSMLGNAASAQMMVQDSDIVADQYTYSIGRDSISEFSTGVSNALVTNEYFNVTSFTYAQPIAGESNNAVLILGWDFSESDYAITGYSLQEAMRTYYWGYSSIDFTVSVSTNGSDWTVLYSGTNVPDVVDGSFPDVQTFESFTSPYEGVLDNVTTFYYKVEMDPVLVFSNGNHWGEYADGALDVTFDVVFVPEPGTWGLALGGFVLIFVARRFRRS